ILGKSGDTAPHQKAKQEWANHGDSPFRVQGGVQVDSADYNPYWLLYLGAGYFISGQSCVLLWSSILSPQYLLKAVSHCSKLLTALRPAECLSDPLPFH